MLLAALDQTIVGTAEPRIIAQLSGFDRYPWVATAYLLTSTISVPIFASLSDIFGRKPFFMLGATTFVLTSALCGAAGLLTFLPLDGMGQLILFRGLQGIGAGMVMGLVFTIIGDIFSPAERGRYQGLFAAMWGLASIFGPTLGGWLTDQVSWRACFWVNLPVGAIAVTAIWLEFPNMKPRGAHRRLDWAGFATLIGCVVPLLLALTWATSLRLELDARGVAARAVGGDARRVSLLPNRPPPSRFCRCRSFATRSSPSARCASSSSAWGCSASSSTCRCSCRACSASRPRSRAIC